VPADGLQGQRGRRKVVRDLGRVHLEPEADPLRLEDLEDGQPPFGEVLVPPVDLGPVVGRERVEHVPDARPGKAVHLGDAERRCGAGRVGHARCRALSDALRVAVPPDLRREDRSVALVDRVADSLADEVAGDRLADKPPRLEQLAVAAAVVNVAQCSRDIEVVTPACELEPVVAPVGHARRQVLQKEVRPLTGEERDGARHGDAPSASARPGCGSSERNDE
jgi:hypothetical protein